jgi:3-phenylpropionate/cinnamic acid dioxygenase small subunit
MNATEFSPPTLREAVADFYFNYASTLDGRDTHRWVEQFTEEGLYTLTTYANHHGKGLYLVYESGRAAITRRAAAASGYLQAQRNKTQHIITNIQITEAKDSQFSVVAYFTMFRTARDKTTQLHACGTFRDRLVRVDGKFLLVEHNVVVDAETLPSNMVDLL